MNHLYYGDNLRVLRESLKDESVDLVYLDPPFNSKRDYNLLFKSPKGQQSEAQITAFEDSWHWGDAASAGYYEWHVGKGKKSPRVQLLTIEGLLSGAQRAEHPDYTPSVNYKKAKREKAAGTPDLFGGAE